MSKPEIAFDFDENSFHLNRINERIVRQKSRNQNEEQISLTKSPTKFGTTSDVTNKNHTSNSYYSLGHSSSPKNSYRNIVPISPKNSKTSRSKHSPKNA